MFLRSINANMFWRQHLLGLQSLGKKPLKKVKYWLVSMCLSWQRYTGEVIAYRRLIFCSPLECLVACICFTEYGIHPFLQGQNPPKIWRATSPKLLSRTAEFAKQVRLLYLNYCEINVFMYYHRLCIESTFQLLFVGKYHKDDYKVDIFTLQA